MKKIIYASIFATLLINCGGVSAADKAYTFTIKGKDEMQFSAMLEPKECMKKVNKVWQQINLCTSPVEPIDLNLGPPLTLTNGELTIDLVDSIKIQAKRYKSAEYPISGYGLVCVYLQQKPKPDIKPKLISKCGPIGGSVNFN